LIAGNRDLVRSEVRWFLDRAAQVDFDGDGPARSCPPHRHPLRGTGPGRNRAIDPGGVSVYMIHTMRSREIIAKLLADGWRKAAQKGSHVQFKHPTKPGRVTVPHPNRDIPIGTLRSIEKQCGLKLR
jgi:predicted RNA binding protein YcfA (HicA-like mRNA interferase family)